MLAHHTRFKGIGLQWPFRDEDEWLVWTSGNELVATLPGRLIRHLVELHLGGAAIQDEMQALVRPLAKLSPRATLPTPQHRDALRKQRRSRRK
jgi:hypothetical protein